MKINIKKKPRNFNVGLSNNTIIDCGKIFLANNELITFIKNKKKYDFVSKDWGYYATPSINNRLKKEGYKVAVVSNLTGKKFIMVVDKEKIKIFKKYLNQEKSKIIKWL